MVRLRRAYEEAYEEGLIGGEFYNYLMDETKKMRVERRHQHPKY